MYDKGAKPAMRRTANTPVTLSARGDQIAAWLARLAPDMPRFEADAVLQHAVSSPGLKTAAPEAAAWLALVAFARHVFTEYDALLDEGYDRDSARHFVLGDLNATLAGWGCRRRVSEEDSGEPDCSEHDPVQQFG